MRLKRTSRVKIFIPVNFLNEDTSVGLKKGGVLTVVRNEVELEVLAGDIPDEIIVDLAAVEIGDPISISNVSLPEGATYEDGEEVAADEVPTAGDEEAAEE